MIRFTASDRLAGGWPRLGLSACYRRPLPGHRAAAMVPIAAARRVLPARGGLPLYAGLGGLALVGIIDWPVAVAAGAGYGLARFWTHTDQPQQPLAAHSASSAAGHPAPAGPAGPPGSTAEPPGSTMDPPGGTMAPPGSHQPAANGGGDVLAEQRDI